MFNPFEDAYHGWQRCATVADLREQEPPVGFDVLGRPWLFRYRDVNAVLLDRDRFLACGPLFAEALGFAEGRLRFPLG